MKKIGTLVLVFLIVFSLTFLPLTSGAINVAYCADYPTDGDDDIPGTSGDDDIDGLEGDDIIRGEDGNDDLYGGCDDDGNDTLIGGRGDDDLYGGPGDDYLYGNGDEDDLRGGPGDDELYGGTGEDDLSGGPGDDIMNGGSGDDDLYGCDDNDTINGNGGEDDIYGGPGDDTIDGGIGADDICGGPGDDIIDGGNGVDDIYGGPGDDIIDGGKKSDDIYGGTGEDTIEGGNGADYLYGGWENDEVNGGNGNDIISGGDGDDILDGGAGNDMLYGGCESIAYDWNPEGIMEHDGMVWHDGNDIINGGEGNDTAVYSGEFDEYDVLIGESSDGETKLRLNNGVYEDELTSVETVNFYHFDDEPHPMLTSSDSYYPEPDEQIEFEFIPLDGYLEELERNSDGTYTAYWGYNNDNEYRAFDDRNYFDDSAGREDRSDMIFEQGEYRFEFSTIVNGLIERWTLGDKVITANATRLENKYRDWLTELQIERNAYLEILACIDDLVERGILDGTESNISNLESRITMAELIELLNLAVGYEPSNNLGFTYEDNDLVIREKMTVVVLTAFGFSEIEEPVLEFEDNDKLSSFAEGYIAKANEQGIITAFENNTFRPKYKVTKADAYRVISKYLRLTEQN